MSNETTNSASAVISPCELYRYELVRTWDTRKPTCCWIMLNPSTADATQDDPTIRRCINFAMSWGCGGIVVVNLFSLRSTDPELMLNHSVPVGPLTDEYILKWAKACSPVVCGWGAHGTFKGRGDEVIKLLRSNLIPVEVLGFTKSGQPKHPLYLKSDLKPIVWSKP